MVPESWSSSFLFINGLHQHQLTPFSAKVFCALLDCSLCVLCVKDFLFVPSLFENWQFL